MEVERWQNVEIRIVFPVPSKDYDPYADERFDTVADIVFDIYEQPIMSGRLYWSDEE